MTDVAPHLGALNLTGGTVITGTGLTLNGDVTAQASDTSSAARIFGGLVFGSNPRTFTVNGQASSTSTALLERLTAFKPATPLEDGVRAFVAWYRAYYRV